jgi:hypothetical protein
VQRILLWHELLHLRLKEDDEGTITFNLRDHEITDFAVIIETEGLEWFHTIQDKTVQLYASDAKVKETDDPEVVAEKESALVEKQERMRNSIKL